LLHAWRSIACICAVGAAVLAAAVPATAATTVAATAPDSLPHASGPLTLRDALALAGRRHLALRGGELRALAARSRMRDEGRPPNPTVRASAENVGGSLGGDRREITMELAQTVELGGERAARAAVAAAEYRVAGADAALSTRDALARTAERFITAWALQARLGRLRDDERLLRRAIAAADERHRAGAAPQLERMRAEAQALAQGVELRRTTAALAIARRELASSWGDREATFDSLSADSSGGVADGAAAPPALERATAGAALAEARVRAAEASRVPDLTVSAGARRLEEARGTGFLVGVELPLPLWNRGNDRVAAERQEYAAADADRRAAERQLEVERANAVDRLGAAAAAYDTLAARVRPARVELAGELLRAYRAGRLGYLDLIAEQRNLLDTDLALVDAAAELWRARTTLELLAGPTPRPEDGR